LAAAEENGRENSQQLRSTGGYPLIGLVKIFATLMKTVDPRLPTTLETEMTPTKDEGPKAVTLTHVHKYEANTHQHKRWVYAGQFHE